MSLNKKLWVKNPFLNIDMSTKRSICHGWLSMKEYFISIRLYKNIRLPGAVPQPIQLFLFCIEFGWGWTKLIIVLCMNLLVEVEIKLHTEFGRVWLNKKMLLLLFFCFFVCFFCHARVRERRENAFQNPPPDGVSWKREMMMKEPYTDIRTRRQKRRESVGPGVISIGVFVPLLLDLLINRWRCLGDVFSRCRCLSLLL